MNRVIEGAVAGAVGVATINAATNLDMLARGRPASTVPTDMAEHLAEALGATPAPELPRDRAEVRTNRTSGTGALLGTLTGVCGGIALALAGRRARSAPLPLVSTVLGVGVMAMTDTSATAAGVTDPRSWGTSGWAADLVPHLLYGWSTAGTLRALQARHGATARGSEDAG